MLRGEARGVHDAIIARIRSGVTAGLHALSRRTARQLASAEGQSAGPAAKGGVHPVPERAEGPVGVDESGRPAAPAAGPAEGGSVGSVGSERPPSAPVGGEQRASGGKGAAPAHVGYGVTGAGDGSLARAEYAGLTRAG